jgi:hypothetical protein
MAEPEYCTYTSVKLDSALINLAKMAAADHGKPIQEWLSDAVNETASRQVGRKPIKRRPPRPRPPRSRPAK